MHTPTMHTSNLSTLAGLAQPHPFAAHVAFGPRMGRPDPWVCFVDSEVVADEVADEQPEAPEPKYTDADVEKLIKRRLTKASRESARSLKAAEARTAELEAALAELNERIESEGSAEAKKTSAQERELTKAMARLKEFEEQIAAVTGERDTASTALKSYIVQDKLRSALVEANVLPGALRHAVSLMATEMQAELENEDGDHVVVVKIAGKETDDLAAAAQAWLKTNAHFAAHPGGGTGETKPRGTNGRGARPLTPDSIETANPAALISSGLSKALSKR